MSKASKAAAAEKAAKAADAAAEAESQQAADDAEQAATNAAVTAAAAAPAPTRSKPFPGIGRILHYVLTEADSPSRAGSVRPAVVCNTYSDTCVALHVFTAPADNLSPFLLRDSVTVADLPTRGMAHWPDTTPGAIPPTWIPAPSDEPSDEEVNELLAAAAEPSGDPVIIHNVEEVDLPPAEEVIDETNPNDAAPETEPPAATATPAV